MKLNYMKAFSLIAAVIIMTAAVTSCKISPVEIETPQASSAPESFGKYDPAIDIRFVRDIDDDIQSNILPKCPGETMENNRWLRLYSDKLGIYIKYDWITKVGDAYTQKINISLASGDLPDVIGVDPSQLKQLADSGMVADLAPYWNEFASPMLKEYYTAQGSGILGSSTFDGKLLGISSGPDMFGDGTFIWIRADWLRKLDLDPPKTMQDVLKISEGFTTEDPDGNGKNDTFGLAVLKNLYNGCMGLEGFFAGYYAYPNMWIEDISGHLVYGSTLPEVKSTLQILANMYKAGQIDQEFSIKDIGNVTETIATGKIGMEFGVQWNPMYPLISNNMRDLNADWTGYPLVSRDGETVRNPNKFGATRFWAVREDYEHPEALIKLYNMHVDMCWGITGDFNKYYMPVENGSVGVWKFSPVTPYPPFKNLDAFIAIDNARKSNTLDKLTGEAATIQRNIEAFDKGDASQWGWMKIYGPEGVFRWGVQYKNNGQYFLEKFTGAPTKTMVEKKTTLDMMEKEVFVKIIMGAAPIDEFDKFVNDWNKLGGSDIAKEVNEWYASVNLREDGK